MTMNSPTLVSRFSYRSLGKVLKSEQPLDEGLMRAHVPSVFASDAHTSRSARYSYIPTIEVLDGLAKEGFRPFFAVQSKSRIEGKTEFTKHMIRLRHESALLRNVSDVNEIILINSHDGTSSYQMLGGCFRFVCQNGCISGDVSMDVRVKHSGNIIESVVGGAHQLLANFSHIDESKDAMKSLRLTSGEQRLFAESALLDRFDVEEPSEAPLTPDQLLTGRRWEDRSDDSLWGTFQRVQENVIRGGLQGRTVDENGRTQRRQTRAVNGIDANVKLNRGLWRLAEEMRKIKAA